MNINAINAMMMNQNLKLKMANMPQEPETKVESYATKPETEASAPAFQGLNMTKLSSGAKKGIMALSAAAALAMTATSCSPEVVYIEPNDQHDVIVNVYVEDRDNMGALIETLMKYFESRDAQLFDMLSQWMTEWQNGRMEDQALLEKMYNLMLTSTENQEIIIDLMVQNGKSDEEARAYLQQILDEVKAGNMTAAEGYKAIMEELGQINDSLDYIKELIKQGFEDLMIQNELLAAREDASNKAMQELLKAILAGEVDIMALIKDANNKLDRNNDALDKVCLNQEKILAAIESGDVNSVGDLAEVLGKSIDEVKELLKELVGNTDIIIDETTDMNDLLGYIANNMVTKKEFNEQKAEFLALAEKALALGLDIKDLVAGLDFSCNCEHNCKCAEELKAIVDILKDLLKEKENEGIKDGGILDDIDNVASGNN